MPYFLRWMLSVAIAAVFLHLGYVYWQRGQPVHPRVPREPGIPRELSGTALKILHFYSSPGLITTEEEATVCYGVLNATAVRIQPPVAEIPPSLNRCIAVAPREPTTYTLFATGRDGQEVRASFTLPVKPAPARFLFADTSEREIRRGQPFTICYGVRNATTVRLSPVTALPPLERHCYKFFPVADTRLVLTASGPGGPAEPLRFAVRVSK